MSVYVPVQRTGRCKSCNARVVFLRGPNKVYPADLMSEDGTAATIKIVRDEKGDPRPHSCS